MNEKISDIKQDGFNENLELKGKSNLYPSRIEIHNDIHGGEYIDGNILYDTKDAVKLIITINQTFYAKNDVLKSVKEICQKVIEYFC